MSLIPPTAASQAGATSGGGLLDFLKGGQQTDPATGLPAQDPGPKGDGSVGLFDGVLSKALLGGALGAGVGFLPFIPGGPILGGIVGALAGAGYGIFKNFKEMKSIQTENQAFLAASGVQINDPAVQQALMAGQPQQILQIQAEQMAATQQGGVDPAQQAAAQQAALAQQTAQQGTPQTPSGDLPPSSLDPGAGFSGGVVGTTSQQTAPPAAVDPATAQAAQSPVPNQAGQLAAGGGATVAEQAMALEQERKASEERIAAMWMNATPEEQEAMLKRLEAKLEELEDMIESLRAKQAQSAA